MNVLCAGYINLDEVLHLSKELEEEKSTGVETSKSPGGGATNTALVLSDADTVEDVYLAGPVGNDKRGDYVKNKLEENGVNLVLDPYDSIPTTKIRAIITDNKKPRYVHEDISNPEIGPSEIDDSVWEKCDHLHVTTFDSEQVYNLAQKAKEHDMSVSLNPTQGYYDESFGDVVELVDLVQMNRQESEVFRDRNGPLGSIVDEFDTDVVITHGPAGSTIHSKDGVASHPGYPDAVDEVVDTIGAGDSFMAGLLSAWLDDAELKDSLRVANSYGATSVTKMGAPNSIDPDVARDIRSNT